MTQDVRANGPTVQIPLLPRGVGIPIEVTVSSRVITISPAAAELEAGETLAFTATLHDAAGNPLSFDPGDLTWGSSNPSVARVDAAGVVTAWHEGETRIVVSYDGTAAAEATVIVTGEDLLALTLTPSKLSTAPGTSFTITAVLTNRGAVSVSDVWLSIGGWPIASFLGGETCGAHTFPYFDRDGMALFGCVVPMLGPGQSASFTFTVATTPNVCVAEVTTEARIVSWNGATDPLLANNEDEVRTAIDCPETVAAAERLVFAAQYDGVVNLYSMNPDGSAVHQLTDNAAAESHPRWSPDRSRIAFIRSSQLWVMNADGSNEVSLGSATHGLSWSPDGTRIVLSAQHPDALRLRLRTVTLATGAASWVPTPDGDYQLRDPDWSPDGTLILVTVDRRNLSDHVCWDGIAEEGYFLESVDAEDGSFRPFYVEHGGGLFPICDGYGTAARWSPDDARIAYERNGQIRSFDRTLYFSTWIAANDRAITTAPHADHRWPAWSPDGTYIVFARRSADSQDMTGELVKAFDIGVLRADGTGPLHNLTNRYTGADMMPHW